MVGEIFLHRETSSSRSLGHEELMVVKTSESHWVSERQSFRRRGRRSTSEAKEAAGTRLQECRSRDVKDCGGTEDVSV